ncbi:hypothetical protein Tco_0073281 [Tanacetum coccineum]
MCTYLKNMEGYKLQDLKFKGFDSPRDLIQENAKKQKVEDDKETSKLKQCLEIIPDEEEATIDVIPLVVKEDLEDLYKLVKAKYESTRPVEDLDLLVWGDLKTMFEPHVEDNVWRNHQEYKVLDWKLYDSCGLELVLLRDFNENMFEVTTTSEYQVNAAS